MPTNDRITMSDGVRILDEDAVWSLAEYLDVPSVLDAAARRSRQTTAVPAGRPGPAAAGDPASAGEATGVNRPGPSTAGGPPTPVLADRGPVTVHRDPVTGEAVALPTAALRALRAAGCAVAAARRLLATGVLTVGVVGAAPEVWWHVAALCRYLRVVTHVAVTAEVPTRPPRLTDQLDLAGVGLTAATTSIAAFGASLVVAATPTALTADQIAPGALVIEAVSGAVPTPLYGHAEAVLPAHAERLGTRRKGFTVVLPPTHTPALDASLAGELLAADTRLGLTGRR